MHRYQYITHSPEETMALAEHLAKQLRAGDIVAYFGDLGMGKTTFTRGLAKGLELPSIVSSPTFAIVEEYHGGRLDLYHFDMYRITSSDDLESTGYYDYPLETSVFAIEWAENIADILPENATRIAFHRHDDTTRAITIETELTL